ncbi:hypothetical protein GE253_14910 [Niveispirillum sp. SYP-B3756]|nr:hypothetical protein [Niveispirillum sp. SYP-B3756]
MIGDTTAPAEAGGKLHARHLHPQHGAVQPFSALPQTTHPQGQGRMMAALRPEPQIEITHRIGGFRRLTQGDGQRRDRLQADPGLSTAPPQHLIQPGGTGSRQEGGGVNPRQGPFRRLCPGRQQNG